MDFEVLGTLKFVFVTKHTFFTLVENMVKKNRSRLSIAVLLTTLSCTR